jgi:hypothetical protein
MSCSSLGPADLPLRQDGDLIYEELIASRREGL